MRRFFILIVLICALAVLLSRAGQFLILDHPAESDFIVVLAGDHNDLRYWRGMELLRAGLGNHMIVDADLDRSYGRTGVERATDFIAQTGGELAPRISVCPITYDSTAAEAADVANCAKELQPPPHSGIIVTHAFHTRRALSIFCLRDPQFRWSVAAARDDAIFGASWWRHREWAKTALMEWEKLLWWNAWERWRQN